MNKTCMLKKWKERKQEKERKEVTGCCVFACVSVHVYVCELLVYVCSGGEPVAVELCVVPDHAAGKKVKTV